MDKQQLGEFNYILVGDGSGSMISNKDTPTKATRWFYMRESFLAFAAQMGEIDSDGIGLILFNGKQVLVKDNQTVESIAKVFETYQPGSSTPTHTAVAEAIKLAKSSNKKAFIQVWTDGTCDDYPALRQVILDQANSQVNDEDLTIQFVQVGKDPGATAMLNELDNLTGAKFDIVNVVTIDQAEGKSIEQLITDGIAG